MSSSRSGGGVTLTLRLRGTSVRVSGSWTDSCGVGDALSLVPERDTHSGSARRRFRRGLVSSLGGGVAELGDADSGGSSSNTGGMDRRARKNASSSTLFAFGAMLLSCGVSAVGAAAARGRGRGIGRRAIVRGRGSATWSTRRVRFTPTMFAQLQELQGQPWRRKVFQVVQMLHIIAVALAVWKGLALVTNTESPVVVVLSGSMEPGFYRGDLLFLVKTSRPIEVGDVTVYRARNTEIPIVHRVLETHSYVAMYIDTVPRTVSCCSPRATTT